MQIYTRIGNGKFWQDAPKRDIHMIIGPPVGMNSIYASLLVP